MPDPARNLAPYPRRLWTKGILTVVLGSLFLYSLHRLALDRNTISTDLIHIPDAFQTPIKTFSPPAPPYQGAVILLHGYGGSKEMLQGLAVFLAQEGFYTFCMDLPGSGDSQLPFSTEQGMPALESAYFNLLGRALVMPDKVALVGHSAGGRLAMQFAAQRREIRATISISALPAPLAEPPLRNLLVLVEGKAPPVRIQEVETLWRQGWTKGLRGDFAQGQVRSAVIVPDAGHLGIVYSAQVKAHVVSWLRGAFGITAPERTVDGRTSWIAGAHISAVLLFIPLAHWLSLWLQPAEQLLCLTGGNTTRFLCSLTVAAWAGSLLAAWFPLRPGVPFVVADYFAWAFLFTGLCLLAGLFALGFKIRVRRSSVWRATLTALAAFLYVYWTIGLTAHREWLHLGLSGGRWALLPQMTLFTAPLMLGLELALRRDQRDRGFRFTLLRSWVAYGILLAGLMLPSMIGIGQIDAFLHQMSLPFLASFFVVIPLLSASLFQTTRSVLCCVLWNTLIYGWLLTAPFPRL